MKKSLLVISVILLIAGLFISCNSEAAGTNSEVGYVKFGDSKELTASITHESGPAISGLYWYYKATKTSGGIAIGATNGWEKVNTGTGLVGRIGPFSKGSWAFELVGTTSTSAPSGTSFNPATRTWTIGLSDGVAYYGVSGTTDEKTRESITLTTGTTVIPVSLKWNKTSSTATVKFDNVSVLDSSETMVLSAETTAYLTVKFGDDVLADNISATNTGAGVNVIYSNTTGLTISAEELGTKNLYVEVYEDEGRTSKVQEGSVGFTAAAGDIITITGNIGSMEAYYGELLDPVTDNPAASVFKVGVAGATNYSTFEAAVEAAKTANDGSTVALLKDVTYDTEHQVAVWKESNFNLDLGGRTFTTESGSSISASNNGYKASAICYGDSVNTSYSVTVKNGTIYTAYGAGIYAANSVTLTIDGVTINAAQTGIQDTKEYSSAIRVTDKANVIVKSGSFNVGSGGYAVVVSNSGGNVTINGGTFSAPLYFADYESSGVTKADKRITITGGTFTNFAVYQGNTNITGPSSNLTHGTLVITGGTFDADPSAYVDNTNYDVTPSGSTWTVTPKI